MLKYCLKHCYIHIFNVLLQTVNSTNESSFRNIINPYLTDGFTHHYQLGESTFYLGMLGVIFIFLSHFSMKFLCANRIAPDGTPRSAVSHLRLYCCLCPTNGTPGLYELKLAHTEIFISEDFIGKKNYVFIIFALNIDCGQRGSNEYPQSMFWIKIRHIGYPCKRIKLGFNGVFYCTDVLS